jgi:hypothetical protein
VRLWLDPVAFFRYCDALRRRSDDLQQRARSARARAASLLAILPKSPEVEPPPSPEPTPDLATGREVIARSRNVRYANVLRRAVRQRLGRRRHRPSKEPPPAD